MNFEILKRSHLQRNIIIGVIAVAIISAVILNFTRAKYRVTQSIPLVRGTVNYSVPDLNLVGIYIQNGQEYEEVESIPSSGYDFNDVESYCTIDGEKRDDVYLNYDYASKSLSVVPIRGMKCYLYFDKVVLTNIEVNTPPNKLNYYSGDNFDVSGLTLKLTYSDGNTKIIDSGFTIENGSNLTHTQTSVTISYVEDGVSKSITQSITVQQIYTWSRYNVSLSLNQVGHSASSIWTTNIEFPSILEGGILYIESVELDEDGNYVFSGTKEYGLRSGMVAYYTYQKTEGVRRNTIYVIVDPNESDQWTSLAQMRDAFGYGSAYYFYSVEINEGYNSYVDQVTSLTENAYPDNGRLGNYWYIKNS